ncbi:Gfo/Idh/MocA family protein [Rothia sp. ZJ932]|uniref:Gfo/Idh/MocA family protein n=1 Tax=Rothia sp. ZJ932 TaxID=2810516 RepID=UPI00196701BB|nr:Gfo/Idh/MocA family oxidoreductase [Rothia sp. ZJ932]QRZ61478.1 Gfo/Idh/MocA family oxidoreductase [Rothia sp. ZJ932]
MADTRTLNIGLISVGWMGKVHTRAYTAVPQLYPELNIKTRLLQVADTSQERIQYAIDVLGYETGTTDYREVLANPDIDIVSICAPNFLHAEMGVAAAAAGKAFWIEKPAGRSEHETFEIASAAAQAKVTTAVGFNYRSAPAIEYARKIITEGQLGTITNVRGAFLADYSSEPNGALSWRFLRKLAGTGVLGDLMGHLADLTHYLVGPISEVNAITKTVYSERPKLPMGSATHFAVIEDGEMAPVENEDYAGLLVRFANGAVGMLESSRVAVGPRAEYSLEIYGTEGSLRWDFQRMNELQLALRQQGTALGYTTIYAGPDFGDFSRFQPGAGTAMGYDDLKVIEAYKFLKAYLGKENVHADISDALLANRVVSAAEKSVETRAWEPVEFVEGTSSAGSDFLHR